MKRKLLKAVIILGNLAGCVALTATFLYLVRADVERVLLYAVAAHVAFDSAKDLEARIWPGAMFTVTLPEKK